MKIFDAFLSYNSNDKSRVEEIARWLEEEAKLRVWFDEWELIPGYPLIEELERGLAQSKSCVFFLGRSGIGPWQNEELRIALAEHVLHETCRIQVVPVLLPRATRPPQESGLPSFLRRRVWVRFGRSKNFGDVLHELVCGIRGVPPRRQAPSDPSSLVCPYRGLEVFREEDRDFFFGRAAVVERLLDYLSSHNFLAVLGPSGSGKSSVVQAGLLHTLRTNAMLIAHFTPRERPLEELAFALHRLVPEGDPTEKILERLSSSEEALHFISRELIDATGNQRIVIVVDQFEELFTQCLHEDERQKFQAALLAAVEAPMSSATVVLTLRSDFLGKCAAYPDLNSFVTDHLIQIEDMAEEELRSVIVKPAHVVGLQFEEGLVDQILEDVQASASELPLLEHALLELTRSGLAFT